jgi:hypothetical protein
MDIHAVLNGDLSAEDAALLTDLGYALENGTLFAQDCALAAKCYEFHNEVFELTSAMETSR